MTPVRQNRYRLRDFEVDPAKHTISGPGGLKTVRASSMEVLSRLAAKPRSYLNADQLLHAVFPASGDSPGLLSACIDELRDALDDAGPVINYLDHDEVLGYRLLVTPVALSEYDDDGAVGDWFDELKRRRVFRAVAAYGVSAWLILQIVDVLSGALPVPDWTMTATTVALAIGFPVSALLAWIFQITPAGVVVEESIDTRKLARTRLVHYFDLVIIGILVIVVAFLSYGHVFPALQRGEEVRVAVLPFENLSGDSADAYLGDGIADDIRSRLYDLPQVLVAARSSSRSLAGLGLDIGTLGERLGVQHILEGTLRRVGDRMRLSVQLVDVDTGFSSWDETYDTRVEDVLEVQNRISLIVASELRVVLTTNVREMLAENATEDPEAFDLYLQARNYLDRPHTVPNLVAAASLFERALAIDPDFALAYAGLCDTHIERFEETGDTAFVQPAERNCKKALSLDTGLAEVHTALGGLYAVGGDLDAAERSFLAAIDIDPRAVDARAGLADVYYRQGKVAEAEAQYILAIELLPANWLGYSKFARFLQLEQRYDESIDYYKRAIDLAPSNANGYNNLGVVYYMLGDFVSAAENYRRSLEIRPDGAAYSNTGVMYYYAGDFAAAEEMFARGAEITPTEYRIWGNLGDARRFSGASDEEVSAAYERAVELANLRLEVNPRDSETLVNLAWYYANLERRAAALSALEAADTNTISDPGQLYMVALVHTVLGDRAVAEQYRDRAASLGFPQAIIDATPELASSSNVVE